MGPLNYVVLSLEKIVSIVVYQCFFFVKEPAVGGALVIIYLCHSLLVTKFCQIIRFSVPLLNNYLDF